MHSTSTLLPQHDRQELAKRLNLSLERFDYLLASANNAYEIIKELGPFYGREDIKEPTFRITAEPVLLPQGSWEILTKLGNDLLVLARTLPKLPDASKIKLGNGLDFAVPFKWRIDAIINEQEKIQVNEIEGQDGASALMMAEQFAYGLQPVSESTAAKFISTLKRINKSPKGPLHIAYIRVNNAHNTNANRLIDLIEDLSNKGISIDHLFDSDIREGNSKPNWTSYDAILSESSMSPQELFSLGVTREQLLVAGNYNAIVNKGVFALIFDPSLAAFWQNELGTERLKRLQTILIPSRFITTKEELKEAYKQNKVVKVSWAGPDTSLINRSRGVAIPEGAIEQSSEERWQILEELLGENITIIAQDYVKPKQIKTFLRKKATNLEIVEWYNRICVKYVCDGNPNSETIPHVELTATEVTLGPDIIPAGRKCAFTAGRLN